MANMADVARRASVSTATVSRVLNGSTLVSKATRERVQRAIADLSYEPNNLGRNMRFRRIHLFGLIVSDIENPFFTAVTRGIEDEARAAGYGVLLCNSDEDPAKEAQYITTLRAERVPGLILAPTGSNMELLRRYSQPGQALVTFGRRVPGLRADFVSTDNAAGARLAVEHFVSTHGYRSIGLVSGPASYSSAAERHASFEATMASFGYTVDPATVVRGDMREQGGFEAANALIKQQALPRALFVVNNLMTLGVLRATRRAGIKVPDDLAIIGFDDVPWAPFLDPPLTVVAQPTNEIGSTAAELLLDHLSGGPTETVRRVLDPALIIRQSCGCR